MAATLFTVACTEDDKTPAPVDETNCPVSFGLGFGTSTGDAELFDNESKISNISIAVFTKGGSFHSVFTPKFDGENYTFEMEEGNWKLWVLANAQTPEALSELLTETSRESDFLNLTVNGTVGKDRKIPMVSANAVEFYHDPETPTTLGSIEMVRMTARIDVVNAVNGLTITRIVMKSRATAGTPAGQATEVALEDKAFNNLTLEGNSDVPAVFAGDLYSYYNPNTSGAGAPSVVVYYTYLGEELSKEFTFDTQLTRNNLYSIQFVFRGEELAYKADTWGYGGITTAIFSSYDLPSRQLAVYRFTETNVKTLNQGAGLVTFCDNNNEVGYSSRWSADYATTTYTDADGNNYRVPTFDEMRLIAVDTQFLLGTNEAKTVLNQTETIPDMFGVAGSGGAGTSDFWIVPNGVSGSGLNHTIYAVRFKNTLQAAAYRYKFESNSLFSIRIKATGMSIMTQDEVCDEEFWADGYIEFKFPANINGDTHYWTSTVLDNNLNQAFRLLLSTINTAVWPYSQNNMANLRLVRVD